MKQLLILSGKGGTGKTTFTSAMIRLAATQVFADCDVDAPNLHLLNAVNESADTSDFVGMQKAIIHRSLCINCGRCQENCRFGAIELRDDKYRVNRYACEGCAVCLEICPARAIEMIDAVAGDLLLYKEGHYFSTAQLRMGSGTSGKLVSEVKRQLKAYDGKAAITIIDGSPGIGCPVIASISGVDMVLVVAEPSLSGFSDMTRIIKTTRHFGTKVAVCVNKVDINSDISRQILTYCQENHIPYVGSVPYDREVPRLLNQGLTILDEPCIAGDHIKEVYHKTRALIERAQGKE